MHCACSWCTAHVLGWVQGHNQEQGRWTDQAGSKSHNRCWQLPIMLQQSAIDQAPHMKTFTAPLPESTAAGRSAWLCWWWASSLEGSHADFNKLCQTPPETLHFYMVHTRTSNTRMCTNPYVGLLPGGKTGGPVQNCCRLCAGSKHSQYVPWTRSPPQNRHNLMWQSGAGS